MLRPRVRKDRLGFGNLRGRKAIRATIATTPLLIAVAAMLTANFAELQKPAPPQESNGAAPLWLTQQTAKPVVSYASVQDLVAWTGAHVLPALGHEPLTLEHLLIRGGLDSSFTRGSDLLIDAMFGDDDIRQLAMPRGIRVVDAVSGALGYEGVFYPEIMCFASGGGENIFFRYGCNQCHTSDGSEGIGPTWKNLFGREETLTDGRVVTVDEAYIRRSIHHPGAEVVSGYQNVMPMISINNEEIDALIEYMKTLSEHAPADQMEKDASDAVSASLARTSQ